MTCTGAQAASVATVGFASTGAIGRFNNGSRLIVASGEGPWGDGKNAFVAVRGLLWAASGTSGITD
jgi:hypothetical protein